jgi:hypothetical protein
VRRAHDGSIFLAVGSSLIMHLGLTLLPVRLKAAELEPRTSLDVQVVAGPVPVPADRGEGERRETTPGPKRTSPTSRTSSSAPKTPRSPERTPRTPGRYETLRPVPGSERAIGAVPGGDFRPDGAPGPGELPGGVRFDGPLRAPKPPVPGDGDGPLGSMFEPDGDGGHKAKRPGFDARVNRDGTIEFKDQGSFKPWAGKFDWSDALMRQMGQDPYLAEKRRVMEETFEARSEMAKADRTDRLREAVVDMPDYLLAIWNSRKFDLAEKRRLFFLLWDEVMEEGDAEVVATGRAVRASILGFIRRHLPEGSANGYTAAELAALNGKRTSRAKFEPY